MAHMMTDYDRNRFWIKVRRSRGKGCWLWGAGCFASGYGAFAWNGKTWRAHRLMWELTNGPIPAGMHVLHTCDTPACVRPDHLFLGTHGDNMRDRWRKGGYTLVSAQP